MPLENSRAEEISEQQCTAFQYIGGASFKEKIDGQGMIHPRKLTWNPKIGGL